MTAAEQPETAVFVGPSVPLASVRTALPSARVEPPVARGDLRRLRREGVGVFLVIDGLFAHQLAVAPSEVVDAVADGARVIGAASLGAIRAAECWPAGVDGVGGIYRLYRLGVLRDDDEVAVAADPDAAFAAVSVALVHVRYLVLAALRGGLLDHARAGELLCAARETHFAERAWPAIFRDAGVALTPELRALVGPTDIKRRDALLALAHLRSGRLAPRRPLPSGRPLAPYRTSGADHATRYRGHDPHFGLPRARLQAELARWLGADGPADVLWDDLEREGELPRELMRWHAAQRLARP